MSRLPSIDADELVTRQLLRAELARLGSRLTLRLTLRLGSAIAVSTALVLAASALT